MALSVITGSTQVCDININMQKIFSAQLVEVSFPSKINKNIQVYRFKETKEGFPLTSILIL